LKAHYYLVRAEPVEYISGPGEKQSDNLCTSGGINVLSVSTGATASTGLPPTTGQDLVTTLPATTVGVSTTAANAKTAAAPATDASAATEMPPLTDNPTADDPHSHIQCLLDGLPDDLTNEH